MIREELERARARLAEATDPRARAVLEGVVLALAWAFEDGGRTPPSQIAAALVTDPLDHDGDGRKGGSRKGRLATARKR